MWPGLLGQRAGWGVGLKGQVEDSGTMASSLYRRGSLSLLLADSCREMKNAIFILSPCRLGALFLNNVLCTESLADPQVSPLVESHLCSIETMSEKGSTGPVLQHMETSPYTGTPQAFWFPRHEDCPPQSFSGKNYLLQTLVM